MAVTEPLEEKAIALGMTLDELSQVRRLLGRDPTDAELAMFSVEWSEHCGYGRSRSWLRLFPKEGKFPPLVGGDAGGIEVAPGLFVLFKMESHNHPSQIEPKGGAATGIGGIVRDILAMGARPIALLDALRFGDPSDPKARYIFRGVIDGIQWYGNCIGVPTVAGEVAFHPAYQTNCLVGVMCVGVARAKELMTSVAKGPGNAVVYVGNKTGRDGIGGCSVLASQELKESLSLRPAVQLGDPFTEKCLIEACLEAFQTGAVVAVKDMGAAGLTCSTVETAAAGGVGMIVDLSLVPRREAGMEPWEVLVSESQERMLLIVERGREWEVERIFRKWGLAFAVIGRIIEEPVLRYYDGDQLIAELPPQVVASAPLYSLSAQEPAHLKEKRSFDFSTLPEPTDWESVLLGLLSDPDIADKSPIYEQYDHMVQTNTVVPPGAGDAAVLALKDYERDLAIAVTADCNSLYCSLDPYWGAQLSVAEAARNLSCVGAEPAGVTDCLCFGNPDKPDRYWYFVESVKGIADACRRLGVPVVSGNVSFYNESPTSVILPTPFIGMIGVLSNVAHHTTAGFKKEGDAIFLLGVPSGSLGASRFLRVVFGLEVGSPPALDWDREIQVQSACRRAIREGLVQSAHDVSEGGLAVALAECCILGNIGADVQLSRTHLPPSFLPLSSLLFGESPAQIVVSVDPKKKDDFIRLLNDLGCPFVFLGQVTGDRFCIALEGQSLLDLPVTEIADGWRSGLSSYLTR
ncbi:MAG: phosphoribosylformylglycinamidine synthase subunit PurL [Armatimonadetes bacterium]|nr:phosphoribosylformylglycinamidine synthase subunit PurL [Armatimonadota bacterium]MDW8120905.1 phosphoribosylformylglycinamidine synthase subunit PurL [Armatimonadota bacterium]